MAGGGHAWWGDMRGRGHAWQEGYAWQGSCVVGVYMAGGMRGEGACGPPADTARYGQ